jgi:Zn-dependent protease
MQVENIVFVLILIISIILHELAHGYAADRMGDPTPRLAGRLTLNPMVHIDWFGSVLLPALLIFSGAPFVLGWAKPVPFNPHYLDNKKWGGALVALAGPLTNIALALVFAAALQWIPLSPFMSTVAVGVVVTNIALAIFNLIPIPPLDGHHILFAVLPEKYDRLKQTLRNHSFLILIVFVLFVWQIISPLIIYLSRFLLGY